MLSLAAYASHINPLLAAFAVKTSYLRMVPLSMQC